ncbi:MAG: triose-phosphate isomerase [Syntrophotaleaceae bacterium]
MRRPMIAGNWKLHKTIGEALELVNALKSDLGGIEDRDIVLAPVFTALAPVGEALKGSNIDLCAQNCYPEAGGAFTGEVSPALLQDVGCRYIIVGHSERRLIFGEDDAFIGKKVKAVLTANLHPVLCIGETLEEREANRTFLVLETQLKGCLQGIDPSVLPRLILAYEPVWAIGTGKTATGDQAEEAHRFIRQFLAEQYGQDQAQAVRILYGGSVKPDNVDGLMAMPNIDGALVGGASLKAGDFSRIVRFEKV